MNSRTTSAFRRKLGRLPERLRAHGRLAYELFKRNPRHPSLGLEKLAGFDDLWSVRLTLHYRAVAIRDRDEFTWFWIGTHSDFDNEFS